MVLPEIKSPDLAEASRKIETADIMLKLTTDKYSWWKRFFIWIGFMKDCTFMIKVLKN